jgi:serine/threonine-protein kinase
MALSTSTSSRRAHTPSTWQCDGCQSIQPIQTHLCPACGLSTHGEDPLVGQRIGVYLIQRRIAGGLLNIVYQGTQLSTQQTVALKRIPSHTVTTLGGKHTLRGLLRTWNYFPHPSAPKIIEIFQPTDPHFDPEEVWWASPWIQGQPIPQLLQQHRDGLPVALARTILLQLCDLLKAYHERGLLHAQLRPEQLFLSQHNGQPHLYISDLGWGQHIGEHFKRGQNQDEGTLRALRYLAPEQLVPETTTIDARADIYACGAIAFQLLTGHPPYRGINREELYQQHLYAPPPRLYTACPHRSYPPALEDLLRQSMAKQPHERPPTIDAFAQQLQTVLDPEIIHSRKTKPLPAFSSTQRNLMLASLPTTPELPASPDEPTSWYLGQKAYRPLKLLFLLILLGIIVYLERFL